MNIVRRYDKENARGATRNTMKAYRKVAMRTRDENVTKKGRCAEKGKSKRKS